MTFLKKARAYCYHSLRFYTGSERPNWKTKEAIEPYYGLNFTFNSFGGLDCTSYELNLRPGKLFC